jgi:hypothetical protein
MFNLLRKHHNRTNDRPGYRSFVESIFVGFAVGRPEMKRLLVMSLLILPAIAQEAGAWSSQLRSGETVQVDPKTNRATITRGGVTSQLWDGAHRMQDGSILITKHGVAVPNQAILQSRELQPPEVEEWQGVRIVGTSPCERLVRRVCGEQNQCSDAQACDPSQQLLARETEERNASKNPGLMTYTSGQCLTAMKNRGFFTACTKGGTTVTK